MHFPSKSLALLLPFALTAALTAQAPVPAQIPAAHTVFFTSAGADPHFPIDSTRVYNDVYAELQRRGHFQLVSSPQQADLVFQLRDVAPITEVTGNHGQVYSRTTPAFQLTILDPHTNTPLWTLTSPVQLAGRKAVFDHWVAIAETNLVSRVQVLANQPLTAAQTDDLVTVPNYHNGRKAIILVSATVAAGVGGGLLLHHLYENSLANDKATQDAFCMAHNIPLNMCAGG